MSNSLSKKENKEYAVLVKVNMKRAYFAALGLLGNHDEAMEASQIAFVKAYKNFKKFDKSKNFFTWYYKILRNLCLNILRDTKRKKEINFIVYMENEENSIGLQTEIESRDLNQKLEKALMELDAKDREIIILKEFEYLSYKEISELLEMPMGSVMSRLYYARKKLSEKLKSVL
jgi:RNA polymerase sigma-70 factor (ECF subfamily)